MKSPKKDFESARDRWAGKLFKSGKGSTYRPVDKQKYDEGWERIFGKKGKK